MTRIIRAKPDDLHALDCIPEQRSVLVTATVFYKRPDKPWLLQTLSWQEDDLYPNLERLKSYIRHWRTNLFGFHGIEYAISGGKVATYRTADGVFRLH